MTQNRPAEDALAPQASAGRLVIDRDALAANYAALRALADGIPVAGVVKANAYGLGIGVVALVLWDAGCRTFFVAHLGEALALRAILGDAAEILVLNGLARGEEEACAAAKVVPVLNTLEQMRRWGDGAGRNRRRPAALQVDSGMSRFGLPAEEVEAIRRDQHHLDGIQVMLVMSHLACADEPDHPANADQLARFAALAALLPAARRSLANSAGMLLGPAYRFDLVRPGIALYGGRPRPGVEGDPAPRPVVRLEGRVAQLRCVPAGAGIGYGFTRVAEREMRLATVAVGYADGWPRALSDRGGAVFAGRRLPVVGRISMDSLILDATGTTLAEGDVVELLGPVAPLDAVAREAGTIAYEILTSLGPRFQRHAIGTGNRGAVA